MDIFDPNGGEPKKINISESFDSNLLPDKLSINDMTVIDEKIYILWSYFNESASIVNEDGLPKGVIYSFGGVLCVDENGIVEKRFTTPELKPISIPNKDDPNDTAVVNYYGPYPESYTNCLYGPTKFIAIKPKKLVFADEGIFVYNDEVDSNNPKYKNINRVVEMDLNSNSVTTTLVSVEFNKDENTGISTYCNYSPIYPAEQTVSAQ